MADWIQIIKDYFLFILFCIACVAYIIYKIWNYRRMKNEAEYAHQMMQSPSFAPPPPPPTPITPPPSNVLRSFEDTADEIAIPVTPKPITRRETVEEDPGFGNNEFDDMFKEIMDEPPVPRQKDVMIALANLTEEMKTNSDVLQGTLEEDLASLRNKLHIVTARREEIKRYGKLLGDLYQRYQHREKQLSIMVVGLERLEEMKQSGLNPAIGDSA